MDKQAKRIQTSVLNAAERKALIWLAERQPKWVTSDMLTWLGVFGSFLIMLGYILSNFNVNWLWLSTFGLFVNWYGDSLDGTVARVRNTQRPLYGYYLDHNVDVLNEALLFIGAGLSPLISLPVALFCLTGYFALTIYTCICQIVKNEFRLTYLGLGPTEFRLIIQILLICFMYIPGLNNVNKQFPANFGDEVFSFSIFDFIVMGIAVLLYVMYAISFHRDRKKLAKIDPLPEPKP